MLTGASNYTGGTFICTCATLQLGDPTHTASIIGVVDNEGILSIVNATTTGITSITNSNAGLTTFSNATTAGTMAISNIGGGATLGMGAVLWGALVVLEPSLARGNLLGIEVTAEDVAQCFLSLAKASKTTGAVLTVDGGNIAAALR